jgi:hypothetical protein
MLAVLDCSTVPALGVAVTDAQAFTPAGCTSCPWCGDPILLADAVSDGGHGRFVHMVPCAGELAYLRAGEG